ncbi:MAG: DUF11 domain-containing protein [Chloroflexi bacterium]|nr:DUF11 domain-containing protein [Chloroflexota bacterium]
MKSIARSEKGATAMLMVMAFMALAVPLVTSMLGLSSVLSIDSRIKTGILKRQYCALGAVEYVRYLTLDPQTWADWWAAHPDGTETMSPCADGAPNGIIITITSDPNSPAVTDEDDAPDNLFLMPPPAYSSRRIQPVKTVETTDEFLSADKTPFTYTITLTNRSDSGVNLNKIHDALPPGLQYDCAGTSTILLPDGVTQQTWAPDPDPGGEGCPTGQETVWNVNSLPPLQSGESVVLTFQATRSGAILADGNYCNEAWAEPGDENTTTGKTATVKVGLVAEDYNVCVGSDAGVAVKKRVTNIQGVIPSGSSPPNETYQLEVEYTITMENLGAIPLNLGPSGPTSYGMRDLLPLGFCYVASSATYQAVSLDDPQVNIPGGNTLCPDSDTRQQLDWDFTGQILSGEIRTLTYTASAVTTAGAYWSDLLVNFSEFSGPPTYTWPTAAIIVRDHFDVVATLDGKSIVNFDLSVGSGSGTIDGYVID